MSRIKVDRITNRAGTGDPLFPNGISVVGLTSLSNVIAGVATFSNVSIGGTLTYEDVTNIDSTGIVTAKSGIKVGSPLATGIGASLDSTGNAQFSGIVTSSSFVGDLNASSLTSGTIPDARFPGTLPAVSGANLTGIEAAPTFQAVASGAIANGKTIVLNSDATVSAAATTLTPESFGTQSTLADSSYMDACMGTVWISDTQFVTSYMRENDDLKMFLAVGTVNGTTITYGTAVQFPGPVVRVYTSELAWDTSINMGIVFVGDNFNAEQKVFTFTVSGSTITFTHTNYNAQIGGSRNCVSVASNNKGGICLLTVDNSGVERVYAGTVDAAGSVSVGSAQGGNGGFDTSVTVNQNRKICGIVYNPDRDVFGMFVQGTSGNNGAIFVRLMTIVGTGVNPGTLVNLNNAHISPGSAITYNTQYKCFVSIYRNFGANNTRMRTWGVDSNTVTTVNSADYSDMLVASGASNASTDYFGVDYNPGTKNAYIYIDRSAGMTICEVEFASATSITAGNSSLITVFSGDGSRASSISANNTLGKVYLNTADESSPYDVLSKIMQAEVITTNLTANNFLGFSAAAYANNDTVTIKTVGNVGANQTGLTTASKYYVTNGGDLALLADDPSVYAGLALNSTSIAVKFPFS